MMLKKTPVIGSLIMTVQLAQFCLPAGVESNQDKPLKEKVLIVDDSISTKTGKSIERVSNHCDHQVGRSVIYNCYLKLSCHNGIKILPVDAALISSSNRVDSWLSAIDKHTCGWKRRKQDLDKKTTGLLQIVDRARHAGLDASFVPFDRWLAHDKIISSICDTGWRCHLPAKKMAG